MRVFVSTKTIKNILSRASTDEIRENINGIWVDTETEMVYATDGHRLCRRNVPQDRSMPEFETVISNTKPKCVAKWNLGKKHELNVLKCLKRFQRNKEITIKFTKNRVEFSVTEGDDRITVEYLCVVIGDKYGSIVINANYLIEALKKLQELLKNSDLVTIDVEYRGPHNQLVLKMGTVIELIMPRWS